MRCKGRELAINERTGQIRLLWGGFAPCHTIRLDLKDCDVHVCRVSSTNYYLHRKTQKKRLSNKIDSLFCIYFFN